MPAAGAAGQGIGGGALTDSWPKRQPCHELACARRGAADRARVSGGLGRCFAQHAKNRECMQICTAQYALHARLYACSDHHAFLDAITVRPAHPPLGLPVVTLARVQEVCEARHTALLLYRIAEVPQHGDSMNLAQVMASADAEALWHPEHVRPTWDGRRMGAFSPEARQNMVCCTQHRRQLWPASGSSPTESPCPA